MFERNAWIREKAEYIDATVNPPVHVFRLTVQDTDPSVTSGPANARLIDKLTADEVANLEVGSKLTVTTDLTVE